VVKTRPELHIGAVFQAAIVRGLDIEGVTFPHGQALDIGTPMGWAAGLSVDGSVGSRLLNVFNLTGTKESRSVGGRGELPV
jgi:hypothetical protein